MKYFTPNINDANITEIFSNCLQSTITAVKSIDETKYIVSLPADFTGPNPSCFDGVPEFDDAGIKALVLTTPWLYPGNDIDNA